MPTRKHDWLQGGFHRLSKRYKEGIVCIMIYKTLDKQGENHGNKNNMA
jgi:hypothetical protein